MDCTVSTGTLTCEPAHGGQGGTSGASCDSRYRNDVVFDAHSASRWSAVFVVDPGAALVVSVFELAGGALNVHKVALAAGDMPQGFACPGVCDEPAGVIPPGAPFPSVIYQKQVITNAVPWVMTDEDDTKLITTPGAYRFELSDNSLVGETYVEARLVRGGGLPAPLIFGSESQITQTMQAAEERNTS
ncbi:hypothetical protein P3T23_004535 [Paraburkholderia sp. GAS448]|uniref:hypothetical protein n=1 Tax=Paraburkholderia sp. GAS448 TaxID=3035136 RepID=UPI003D24E60F